jgi:hypothetical protein
LGEVLEELLQGREEAEREHAAITRSSIKELIPKAIQYLSPSGRGYFSLDQLVLAVRQFYKGDVDVARHKPTSLETREAIEEYGHENPKALSHLIRRREVQLLLPNAINHAAVTATSVTGETLANACVDKVLVFSDLGMCDVFVTNDLLRRFDVALLAVDGTSPALTNTLATIAGWKLPLLLAHDATISGSVWNKQVQDYLSHRKIKLRVYDLGLTPAQGKTLELASELINVSDDDKQRCSPALSDWETQFLLEGGTYRLLSLSPQLLRDWFQNELRHLGIREKLEPAAGVSRTAAQRIFRLAIEKWVLEKLGAELGIDVLLDSVVSLLHARCNVEALTQVRFESEDVKRYSWYTLLEELVSAETSRQLTKNDEELRSLIRRKAGIVN